MSENTVTATNGDKPSAPSPAAPSTAAPTAPSAPWSIDTSSTTQAPDLSAAPSMPDLGDAQPSTTPTAAASSDAGTAGPGGLPTVGDFLGVKYRRLLEVPVTRKVSYTFANPGTAPTSVVFNSRTPQGPLQGGVITSSLGTVTPFSGGTNVPGKKRSVLVYQGGLGFYRDRCNEIAQDDYRGFVFEYDRETQSA